MKIADGYMCYYDKIEPMRHLSDAEYGAIRRATDDYAETGALPNLPPTLEPYFLMWKPSIDAGKIKYAEKCIKRTHAAACSRLPENNRPQLWEWYASFDGYDPALFKKEPWYDLAYASRCKQMQADAAITNTIQHDNDIDPNHNPGHESELAAIRADLLPRSVEIGAAIDNNDLMSIGNIMRQCGISKDYAMQFKGATFDELCNFIAIKKGGK